MSVPNNGPTINGGMWLMTILPVLFISLRLYCKSRLGRVFGWDEYVLICSWCLLLVYTSLISSSVSLGVGKHVKDIMPQDIAPALERVYIGEFFAIVACALAKTSFAITLLRTVTSQWQKALLWFIIVTMNLIMWLCAIIYIAQCQPSARLWDFTLTEGYCWNPAIASNLAIAAGAYSGAMDFILALLPWTIVWNLKINKKEKLGVGIAMSLGMFAGVVAIIKTSYLTNLVLVQDFTFYCSNILIWAATETSVTLMAVCIPFFRTLLHSYSRNGSYGQSGESNSYQLDNKQSNAGNRRSKYWQMPTKNDEAMTTRNGSSPDSFDGNSTTLPSRTMSQSAIKMTSEITISYEDSNAQDEQRRNHSVANAARLPEADIV